MPSDRTAATPDADAHANPSGERRLQLTGYRLRPDPLPLVCATKERDWMDATDGQYAYRCLPLLIANQAGWFVLNDVPVECIWDGRRDLAGVRIRTVGKTTLPPSVTTHFGEGIITWHVSYLFRTPPGYNLLVRGPSNWPKDGVQPLEGLVESDWTSASFTMNWKITRPRRWVRFDAGEPICMIVPQRRGELEAFETAVQDLDSNPELSQAHKMWGDSRAQFLSQLKVEGSDAANRKWQKDYFQGRQPNVGRIQTQHQTVLRLKPFAVAPSDRDRT